MKVKGGGRRRTVSAAALPAKDDDAAAAIAARRDDADVEENGSSPPLAESDQQEEARTDEEVDEDENDSAEAKREDERPKLDEGFYEIEAVRRRRIRKGQLQYLIKWRGWPETANTWEPLENLQSCSDVIEAFEESMRSGRQRKRKRKYGAPHSLPKKKPVRSGSTATDPVGSEIVLVNQPWPSTSHTSLTLSDPTVPSQSIVLAHEENTGGDIIDVDAANNTDANIRAENVCQQIDEIKDKRDYNPKLSELKATLLTSEVGSDKLATQFQENKAFEGNGSTNGLPKIEGGEPVQSTRCTGSRRRKSGSVKRFKQDATLYEPVMHNSIPNVTICPGALVDQRGPETFGDTSSQKNKINDSRTASAITEIIKPISFKASVLNNVQDVAVMFIAKRSDGKEVMVDNKFLKASNPLLLINFYERHLKYCPST